MTIHFLFTPDSSSARRLKRLVAELDASIGIVVGTWPELLNLAAEAYLVPQQAGAWEEKVGCGIREMDDAFWSKSMEAAESETVRAVNTSLRVLLEGISPNSDLPEPPDSLAKRARRHYKDLAALHGKTGGVLPDDLEVIKMVLERSAEEAIQHIRVYSVEGLPRVNPWLAALIEKLNGDCAGSPDPALEQIVKELQMPASSSGQATAARVLAESLFDPDTAPVALDSSIQWLGVRDYLEEAEVACGMVQKALKADPDMSWKDFSLLIPADTAYSWAIREVFGLAGLPLSGLPEDARIRDLGREAILYFILCRRRPAPNMALAALVTSPLMPWPESVGYQIAQGVMDGRYDFQFREPVENEWVQAWRLIRDSEEKPGQLKSAINDFVALLNSGDGLDDHLSNARSVAESAGTILKDAKEIHWEKLIEAVSSETLLNSDKVETTQEGIAVFTEHQEPWRKSQHLTVLGFAEGRYPAVPHRSPVFFDEDVAAMKYESGLNIQTQADLLQERRELLKRQISSAESITFLVPRRDGLGGSLTPSQSMPFMARLFDSADDPEKLILDLEKTEDRKKAIGISTAAAGSPVLPRARDVSHLNLGRDLLMLKTDEDGNPKAQSPSRLGTLMTSSFAWLLDNAGIKTKDWGPEELSVAEKGTLAHDVFEHLFVPGKALPGEKRIRDNVNKLLNDAITNALELVSIMRSLLF